MPSVSLLAGGRRLIASHVLIHIYGLFLMSLFIFTAYFSCSYPYYRLFLISLSIFTISFIMSLSILQTISYVLTIVEQLFSMPLLHIITHIVTADYFMSLSIHYYSCPYPMSLLQTYSFLHTISHVHIADHYSWPILQTITHILTNIALLLMAVLHAMTHFLIADYFFLHTIPHVLITEHYLLPICRLLLIHMYHYRYCITVTHAHFADYYSCPYHITISLIMPLSILQTISFIMSLS